MASDNPLTISHSAPVDNGTGIGGRSDDIFYVDKTEPQTSLTLEENLSQPSGVAAGYDYYNRWLIEQDSITASITGSDNTTSGVYQIDYFTVAPSNVDIASQWSDLYRNHGGISNDSYKPAVNENEGAVAKLERAFSANDRFLIGIRVVDRS